MLQAVGCGLGDLSGLGGVRPSQRRARPPDFRARHEAWQRIQHPHVAGAALGAEDTRPRAGVKTDHVAAYPLRAGPMQGDGMGVQRRRQGGGQCPPFFKNKALAVGRTVCRAV